MGSPIDWLRQRPGIRQASWGPSDYPFAPNPEPAPPPPVQPPTSGSSLGDLGGKLYDQLGGLFSNTAEASSPLEPDYSGLMNMKPMPSHQPFERYAANPDEKQAVGSQVSQGPEMGTNGPQPEEKEETFDISAFRKNKIAEALNAGDLNPDIEEGPITKALLEHIQRGMPREGKPSFGRKLVAAGLSLRPNGTQESQQFLHEPYNRDVSKYQMVGENLYKGANLEARSGAAHRKYLMDVGNLIAKQGNYESQDRHRVEQEGLYGGRTAAMNRATDQRASAATTNMNQLAPVRRAQANLANTRAANVGKPRPQQIRPIDADTLAQRSVLRNPAYADIYTKDSNGAMILVPPTDPAKMGTWKQFLHDVAAERARILANQPMSSWEDSPGPVKQPGFFSKLFGSFRTDGTLEDDEEQDDEEQE